MVDQGGQKLQDLFAYQHTSSEHDEGFHRPPELLFDATANVSSQQSLQQSLRNGLTICLNLSVLNVGKTTLLQALDGRRVISIDAERILRLESASCCGKEEDAP